MPNERIVQIVRECFIPALTADLNHDHRWASEILKEYPPAEVVEVLFGFCVQTIAHTAANRGVEPVEIVREMAVHSYSIPE